MLGLKSSRADSAVVDTNPKGYDDFTVTLGDVMRGERATLGKSLMDVQRELKIKASYIAAVEDADPSVFDTPGFIAGYVRSYAKYLEVDPEWAFDKFCAESGFATIHGMSERALPARMSREDRLAVAASRPNPLEKSTTPYMPVAEPLLTRLNAKAIASSMILVLLVGALGYGAYSVVQEVQQVQMAPIEQSPFVASDIDPLAPRQTRLNGATDAVVPDTAAVMDRLYRPVALEVPVLEPRDGPIAAINPNSTGAFVPPTVPDAIPSIGLPDIAGVALQDVAPVVQVVEEAPREVAFFSTSGVWLRVLGADGSTLYQNTIEPGELFAIPATEEGAVVERAGNAGALFFKVNGEVYGPAGRSGGLVKGIDLSEDGIKERYVMIPEDQRSETLQNSLQQLESVVASQ